MKFFIRDAVPEDLPKIVEAYNTSIPSRNSTCDTKPITVASRDKWLSSATRTRPIWVAVEEGKGSEGVLGYLSFSNFMNDRPGYAITADLGLYIHSDFHGLGIGKALLEKAIKEAPNLGIETLTTTIFASNEASVHLFLSKGFERWGYMPRVARLEGTERDLIMVGVRLVEPEPPPTIPAPLLRSR